jgi:hypothetical protein
MITEPLPEVLGNMETWMFIFKEQGISSKYIPGTRNPQAFWHPCVEK